MVLLPSKASIRPVCPYVPRDNQVHIAVGNELRERGWPEVRHALDPLYVTGYIICNPV